MNVLYISYDGMTDPLGQAQVLPYLVGLARCGHSITLLSCEKPARFAAGEAVIRRLTREAGIEWHPVRYHAKPPILAPLYNKWRLGRLAMALQKRIGFDLIHCRSYISASIGLALKRKFGTPFLFDMRGFWPDERVDGGLWPQSSWLYRQIYKRAKALEADLVSNADHVVSLTAAGRREMLRWPAMKGGRAEITVIPCCADFNLFQVPSPEERLRARNALGFPVDGLVAAYLGSVGTWYMLDEMLDLFAALLQHRPDAYFLFVTPDPPELVLEAARKKGLQRDKILIRSASRAEVPHLMAAADLGLFFILPAYSKTASSPTKMGEMMAMGLPLIANAGVGDVEEILDATQAGVLVKAFDPKSLHAAAGAAMSFRSGSHAIRTAAMEWFSLEAGINAYGKIYKEMQVLGGGRGSPVSSSGDARLADGASLRRSA